MSSSAQVHQGEEETSAPVPGADAARISCAFILGTEFCERLAFYGIANNLVLFFQNNIGLSSATAAANTSAWSGACYISALFGAWIADSIFGRYKTIVSFCTLYCLGLVLLTVSAMQDASGTELAHSHPAIFFVALYTVAIGTGGIKPNVSPLGADQFDPADPNAQRDKEKFFNWFYWTVNLGALVSSVLIVYIQVNVSWVLGFAVPAAAMFAATLIFRCGRGRYKRTPPADSPLARSFAVLRCALPRWLVQRGRRRRQRRPLPPSWVLYASQLYGGPLPASQVESVRLLLRTAPVFGCSVMFWAVYAQMNSTYVLQGQQLDRRIGGVVVPSASLTAVDTVAIILLIPVFDRCLFPLLRRCCGVRVTVLRRVGAGLACSVLSMLCASALEHRRLALFAAGALVANDRGGGGDDAAAATAGEGGAAVALSIAWQIPQYLLIGASETLASIGQLEFFYDQAPPRMRSLSMALQLLAVACGNFVSAALVAAVQMLTASSSPWIPATSDLNTGHLDRFYLAVAALAALNFLAFLLVARSYNYSTDAPPATAAGDAADGGDGGETGRAYDSSSSSSGSGGGSLQLPPLSALIGGDDEHSISGISGGGGGGRSAEEESDRAGLLLSGGAYRIPSSSSSSSAAAASASVAMSGSAGAGGGGFATIAGLQQQQ